MHSSMTTSTSSRSSPLPTLDAAICEIIVNYRIPFTALSPAQFVIPFSLNRPCELLMTDLDDDDAYTATHHSACRKSEVSECLAEVPMMFVTEIKIISQGHSNEPRSKEEDESDALADERGISVPTMQTSFVQQREVDTHVDAEQETQAQLNQGRNPDDHGLWGPLSRAALQSMLQSIQQKESQEAQRTTYTDHEHNDSGDVILDYEQGGNDAQQQSVERSNKRKVLPFGSGLLKQATEAEAKRRKAA